MVGRRTHAILLSVGGLSLIPSMACAQYSQWSQRATTGPSAGSENFAMA